jgi:hypothetical protein
VALRCLYCKEEHMKKYKWRIAELPIAALLIAAFVTIPFLRFRFIHPCLTETQLLLHTVDALMWRTIDVCKP